MLNLTWCLEGTVSDSLVELKHLKYLDLSVNDFQGQSIPKFIGSLAKLEHLNLSYSEFSGVIPNEIGNLSRLSSLDLNSDGGMSVEGLSWLSQLRLLRYIDLGGVDLSLATNWVSVIHNLPFLEVLCMDFCSLSSTPFPLSLSYMNSSHTLRIISLSGNNLNGPSIFHWLHNLSRIETTLAYLDLSYNNLNEIPTFIWTINSLSHLNLRHTNSSCLISSEISNLRRLTYIHLGSNTLQLSRQFLKSFVSICSLQTLALNGNNLTYDFSELMESLSCSHNSLVFLDLSNTRVWGSIPNCISNFSLLEELDLSFNNLSGVVSHNHLSNLSNLTSLDLSGNHALVLNLSADWKPPFKLVMLNLRSCKVGPTFPKWLVTQQSLSGLDISDTGIFDVIPESFWTLVTLQVLNMSNNMIYGVLPDSSFPFPILQVDMSSNKLSGTIPSSLGNATELYLNNNNFSQGLSRFLCPKSKSNIRWLDLSNNLFSETLPDCWQYFPYLGALLLQNNNISGKLPPSIAAMNFLQTLHLGNNRLNGELHVSWVNFTFLAVLDLSYNSFTGSIPTDLGNSLWSLRVLSLKNNHLSKDIPQSLCQLTSLQTLDLSSNHLTGSLPKCLSNFINMANNSNFPQPFFIDYYVNHFGGDFAQLMWNRKEHSFEVSLGLLKGIDISNNNLQGQIPDEISSLVGIRFLNLSNNNLSGPIPSRIGQLTSLQFLDLSHNRISGDIPTSLASINGLAILDVSNNNLSGKIPLGTQLRGFNASSYMDNPELCGEPLPKCPGDEESNTSQTEDNIAKQTENNNNDIFVGLIISVVLGFITGFWGVCGTLVLKRSWRHAFFRFYDDVKDKIYVMVVVNIARLCRRFSN